MEDEDDLIDRHRQGLGLDESIIQSLDEERRGEGVPLPEKKRKITEKSVRFNPKPTVSEKDTKLKPTASKESRKRIPKNNKTDEESAMFSALHEVTQRHIKEVEAMGPLTEEDIPQLRDKWHTTCQDIMQGTPLRMPKARKIHHEIPLLDPDKRYKHRLPKCPDAMKQELMEKMKKYTAAGWWEPVQTDQAAPMLCVPKKNGKLRTPVDLRQRNDNTVRDITPLPDQDQIRMDVARAKYRSKIDFSDAYEQVRVKPEDVAKNAFATIYGTYVSHVMIQGDCNAPATFQRIMTDVFRDYLNIFVHVYLDDVFVFSDSIEEHEHHLALVFDKIREQEFFLKKEKCELYAKEVDCLGHIVDDKGLHADADKMARIRDWRQPRNYHEVQKFLGLVQYLAHFLPNITQYTGPLAGMCANGQPFSWRPIHQHCFEMVKQVCCTTPVLVPIDPRKPETIFVICDASVTGVGAMYGQGSTWDTCRPAGMMSRKFTTAQRNYHTTEQETIAILEALLKWEDKLIGYPVTVVTDHKSLEYLKTQTKLSSRQTRWLEFLQRFNISVKHVDGINNKVADALSRYYEYDTWEDKYPPEDYVNADVRLDPTLDELSWDRLCEVKGQAALLTKLDVVEQRPRNSEGDSHEANEKDQPNKAEPELTVNESRTRGENLRKRMKQNDSFVQALKDNYPKDPLFSKVMKAPKDHPTFRVHDGLIWTRNSNKEWVVCLPKGRTDNESIRGMVIDQAHTVLGHFGPQRTADYIRRWYWWPRLQPDMQSFCNTCRTCHTTKDTNQQPAGLLHSLPVPTRPWQSIGMDFIGPFPEHDNYSHIWVVICRLTSMIHAIPVSGKATATQLASIFLKEVVRLHGLPESIVSDRDPKFTSKWWKEIHRLLGTKLLMSTSFHPQTDGATERANRSVAQILRASVRPDQKNWYQQVPMMEFAINSAINASTGYAPFDLNYAYMPSMIKEISLDPPAPPGVRAFAAQALYNIKAAHDAIIASRVFHRHYANTRRREDPEINEGDLVYLSTKNLSLPKARASKLLPRYVGPYKIVKAYPRTSTYEVELPPELVKRRVHPVFHVSLLRPYQANDDAMFPNRTSIEPYDFGAPEDTEWYVDEITAHKWDGKKLLLQVQWNLGDTTWEPIANCKELEALDRYLELLGIDNWRQLPQRTTAAPAVNTRQARRKH